MSEAQYQVALSFAGEDRAYVSQVAAALEAHGVLVFYDAFEETNLWGKNLYDYLSDLYSTRALQTVMFISQHYARKLWPTLERQSMQARAFQESEEYILPVRFDDTVIPGLLPTVGYLSLAGRSPEALAQTIIEKLEAASAPKLLASAWLLHDRLRWSAAARYLDIYVKKEPGNSEGHFLRGVAYANLEGGRTTDAIACESYGRALALAPATLGINRRARYHTYFGAMLKRVGRLDEAEKQLRLAEPLAGNYYEAHDIMYNFACVYALQGRRLELLAVLRKLQSAQFQLASIRKHATKYFADFQADEEFIALVGPPPSPEPRSPEPNQTGTAPVVGPPRPASDPPKGRA